MVISYKSNDLVMCDSSNFGTPERRNVGNSIKCKNTSVGWINNELNSDNNNSNNNSLSVQTQQQHCRCNALFGVVDARS